MTEVTRLGVLLEQMTRQQVAELSRGLPPSRLEVKGVVFGILLRATLYAGTDADRELADLVASMPTWSALLHADAAASAVYNALAGTTPGGAR